MAENPYLGVKPDLSKLPIHLREAMGKAMPMRETEIYAKIIIFANVRDIGLNHPNGRLQAIAFAPDSEKMNDMDGIQLEMYNFTAQRPLATTIIGRKDFAVFLKGFFKAYMLNKMPLSDVTKIIEELDNE